MNGPFHLIVTDTSPLITLALADALDVLLRPSIPVSIPDAVYVEATRIRTAAGEPQCSGDRKASHLGGKLERDLVFALGLRGHQLYGTGNAVYVLFAAGSSWPAISSQPRRSRYLRASAACHGFRRDLIGSFIAIMTSTTIDGIELIW